MTAGNESGTVDRVGTMRDGIFNAENEGPSAIAAGLVRLVGELISKVSQLNEMVYWARVQRL